jgi:hypothetical protein
MPVEGEVQRMFICDRASQICGERPPDMPARDQNGLSPIIVARFITRWALP